ncbi:MAG: DUF3039 domain-containing protein [Acidimicrobiia bacterium]
MPQTIEAPTLPAAVPVTAPTPSPSRPDGDARPDPGLGDGDHDRFAHYCRREDVMRAYVTGEAIEALCGKKWVPTRDPEKYPVCPTCVERKAAGWQL